MYINFEDDKTVYSFNGKEQKELDHMCDIFDQYGKIELKEIQDAITTEFAVKVIPLFYKVYSGIYKNVILRMKYRYTRILLYNPAMYTEYGLFIKENLRFRNRDLPEYLEREINRYQIEYKPTGIKTSRMFIYEKHVPLYIDQNFIISKERPYDSSGNIIEKRPINKEDLTMFDLFL